MSQGRDARRNHHSTRHGSVSRFTRHPKRKGVLIKHFNGSRHHVKDSPVVLRAQFGTFRLHPSRRSFVQKMIWLVGHNTHARMPEVFRAVCVAFEPVFHIVKMRRLQFLLPPTK